MTTLLDVWKDAWYFMKIKGFPLEGYQENLIVSHVPSWCENETRFPTQENLVYFITEHFENTKWPEMPPEVKTLIFEYKLSMMKEWKWPEWGYKDMKQFKPISGDNNV